MNQIPDTKCPKCGGETKIRWVPSSGMDIEQTGMKRTCIRCGYSDFIDSLDEKKHRVTPLEKVPGVDQSTEVSECCHAELVEDFKENPRDHHDPHPILTCAKCHRECQAIPNPAQA